MRRHRLGAADAEEVVQEAVRQFLGSGGVVDAADTRALLMAIGSRVNGIAVDMRRKKALRAVGLTHDGLPAEVTDPEGLDTRQFGDDVARKGIAALLERVADDELVHAIVLEIAGGVDEPAEQARVLGRNVRDIYNARRRLTTHVQAVTTLMESW